MLKWNVFKLSLESVSIRWRFFSPLRSPSKVLSDSSGELPPILSGFSGYASSPEDKTEKTHSMLCDYYKNINRTARVVIMKFLPRKNELPGPINCRFGRLIDWLEHLHLVLLQLIDWLIDWLIVFVGSSFSVDAAMEFVSNEAENKVDEQYLEISRQYHRHIWNEWEKSVHIPISAALPQTSSAHSCPQNSPNDCTRTPAVEPVAIFPTRTRSTRVAVFANQIPPFRSRESSIRVASLPSATKKTVSKRGPSRPSGVNQLDQSLRALTSG